MQTSSNSIRLRLQYLGMQVRTSNFKNKQSPLVLLGGVNLFSKTSLFSPKSMYVFSQMMLSSSRHWHPFKFFHNLHLDMNEIHIITLYPSRSNQSVFSIMCRKRVILPHEKYIPIGYVRWVSYSIPDIQTVQYLVAGEA